MENRIGKIKITSTLIEKSPLVVAEILAKIRFIPFRVEHLFSERSFEMIGWSTDFAIIPDHEITPEYMLTMESEQGKLKDVVVERIEKS